MKDSSTRLISSPASKAHICDKCVAVCNEILKDDPRHNGNPKAKLAAMIPDEETAKQVSDLLLEIYRQMDASLQSTEPWPPEEHEIYKIIGRLFSQTVHGVITPFYEKYPTLKPPNWDEFKWL